jgi:predicted esterase YcpF (UPF0227 family)
MILFCHGFGSSAFSKKATILKKHFGDDKVFAPSLHTIPKLAIDTLEQSVQMCLGLKEEVYVVGSSLGGYYALYLSNKYDLKAVLVNPSIYPYKTLAKNIGLNHNFFDFSDYEFVQSHIDSLKEYEVCRDDYSKILLLTQKGDEVLDYKEACDKLDGAVKDIEDGGSHSYDNFENKLSLIETFLEKQVTKSKK